MGILDQIRAQGAQTMGQSPSINGQGAQPQAQQQGGDMAQMYQILMENSLRAIEGVAQQRLQEKGVEEGCADLVATAMTSNLQAANQNGKAIPPQILLQVGKDIAFILLQEAGVPEEEIDDILLDVLLQALEKFGDMAQGLLTPEEEQQYIQMINQINQAAKQMAQQAPNEQMQENGGG